jgi:hypothetical protein
MAWRAGAAIVMTALVMGSPALTAEPPPTAPLDGVWLNTTTTPLQRLPQFGDRLTMTPEEAAEAEAKAFSYRGEPRQGVMRVGGQPRTSIITSPADGRIPPRRADAPTLSTQIRSPARPTDNPESRSLSDRCIMGPGTNTGAVLLPFLEANRVQFVVTKDEVVILTEKMHDVRHVRMNARSHAPVRQWLGDSVGRWEDETLVVETTNFHPRQYFYGASEKLKVVERFTRTAPDRLLYRFTVQDPLVWDQPWSGEYEFRPAEAPVQEYACHEGNYSLDSILAGAREEEARLRQAIERVPDPR